ncbi:MAG: peptidoglycan DD-metalloendopeptidase family protein [Planctomycetota bacterium]
MESVGRFAMIVLIVFLIFAALLIGLSVAGFWGGGLMIATAIVAILAWGAFFGLSVRALVLASAVVRSQGAALYDCLAWTRALFLTTAILSVVTAFVFGFGAFATCGPTWLAPAYHWGGCVGSVLGFGAWFVLPWVVRAYLGAVRDHGEPHRWWTPIVLGGLVYGLWGLVWLIVWLVLRGDIDTSTYPNRSSSPYLLPYPGGDSSWVVQGNNSSLNHNGDEQHSWDFRLACGTPVLAARAGTVSKVVDKNDGHDDNNMVEIAHGDGTTGRYLHIERGSATVKNGDAVVQGQQIAKVGNVGNSLTGHIHFVVERANKSIPVTFQDVDDDSGIPRTFGSYESGNSKVP